MAYEFPSTIYGDANLNELLLAVKNVLEMYNSINGRLTLVESDYPKQWQTAIAAQSNADRDYCANLIKVESDRLQTQINGINMRIDFVDNQITQLKVDMAKFTATMTDNFNAMVDETTTEIDSIKTYTAEKITDMTGQIETLQTNFDELEQHVITDIDTLQEQIVNAAITVYNPITGEYQATGDVINMMYNSLRTATTLTVAQLEASSVTVDDVSRQCMSGPEISGGGILCVPKTYVNPITGEQHKLPEILSFMPDTTREYTNQEVDDITIYYGEPKEKDMDYGDWRENKDYFSNEEAQ